VKPVRFVIYAENHIFALKKEMNVARVGFGENPASVAQADSGRTAG
jgi:hypothetical protein